MATVFVIQDIPGSKIGAPKINIIGATEFGNLKVLLPENSQIILSPAYVIQTLRKKLQEYKKEKVVTEKDDRCTRIAKRKYDTWPSAYASGAVVRCRRGEIWKKKK